MRQLPTIDSARRTTFRLKRGAGGAVAVDIGVGVIVSGAAI